MPDGGHIESSLNNDGSGRVYDEIQEQFGEGYTDLGLIGWSHGAGMTENISTKLRNDSNTPLFCGVVFSDTIDGVKYGTGMNGSTNISSMTVSPASIWGGAGFNYFETISAIVHGAALAGAVNNGPFGYVDHGAIGRDTGILNSVEADVDATFT